MNMQLDEFSQTDYPKPTTAGIQNQETELHPQTFRPLSHTSINPTGDPLTLYILCDFSRILQLL